MKFLYSLSLFLFFSLFLVACSKTEKVEQLYEQLSIDYDILLHMPATRISYQDDVRPILEKRCIVCHGCFDAPCQLKLSSLEGLQRGSNPQRVYDGARIKAASPTRLFIDANQTSEWREKGFNPVVRDKPTSSEENLRDSVMYQLLRLKERHPQARVGKLSEEFTLDLGREQTCPTQQDVRKFSREHPQWGMPYAMPNLTKEEYRTLVQWIAQGAHGSDDRPVSTMAAQQVRRWEAFLNGPSLKQQLVSRYLYEHLFLAHLHFSGTPEREFYRLVRSSTPPGEPIAELPTVRPYDDPGSAPFYYRLRPYKSSIVAKSHVVYELSDERMARYKSLFIDTDYSVEKLPGYAVKTAANPFKVFNDIPPNSRYRFLLDDARFFIEGFIKGPVCRGQIALNVIEDQFWVFFFNPDKKIISDDAAFLDAMSENLRMPNEQESTLKLWSVWTEYWTLQKNYIQTREAYLLGMHRDMPLDSAMDFIWDGDGVTEKAGLTIYRHFDSASVEPGLSGNYPETAWIIDYPLLERIHYLLVAGFNVYGNMGHQLSTRLFMDFLRMEGETQFLVFLPKEQRRAIRDSWYVGVREDMQKKLDAPQAWLDAEIVVGYQSNDPKLELFRKIEEHIGISDTDRDFINRCRDQQCTSPAKDEAERRADAAMQRIAHLRGENLRVVPDVAFVRVRTGTGADLTYTLIHNKAYTNISSIFENEDRRSLEFDTLTVKKGLTGSYPNFFFDVKLEDLERFSMQHAAIETQKDYEAFVMSYGIRRTNPDFWAAADWFQTQLAKQQPLRAGILDLNRYRNR